MEIFNTILSGVLVYVLGEFILKIFIEPIQSLKKEIEETLNDCTYYGNAISRTANDKLAEKAFDAFRKHSGLLKAKKSIIPCFDFLASFGLFPNSKSMTIIFNELMFISNSSIPKGKENDAKRMRIEKLLQKRVNIFELICNLVIFLFFMAGTVQIITWLYAFIESLKSSKIGVM